MSTISWYIDSGASRHMTGVKEFFSYLTDKDEELEVVLGDDSVVRAVGIGTVSFERESQSPM